MPKIKVYIDTGFPTAKHSYTTEIDDAEWDEMSEEEREQMLDDLAIQYREDTIECGAYVIE